MLSASRTGGRSAAEIRAAIEAFLSNAKEPALLEPGEELMPLSAENFHLEPRGDRLTLQAWDRTRNLTRRVTGIQEQARGAAGTGSGAVRQTRRPDVSAGPGAAQRRGPGPPQRTPGVSRALPPVPAPPVSRMEPGRSERRSRTWNTASRLRIRALFCAMASMAGRRLRARPKATRARFSPSA